LGPLHVRGVEDLDLGGAGSGESDAVDCAGEGAGIDHFGKYRTSVPKDDGLVPEVCADYLDGLRRGSYDDGPGQYLANAWCESA
jgi:hypothetical protein